jgi:hypothetical protein
MFSAASNNRTISVAYDGDGSVVKRSEIQQNTLTSLTYYLRSSVLGGKIITELNQSGQKQKGYVFAGGQLLASQQSNQVTWRHQNPVTGSSGISAARVGSQLKLNPIPPALTSVLKTPTLTAVLSRNPTTRLCRCCSARLGPGTVVSMASQSIAPGPWKCWKAARRYNVPTMTAARGRSPSASGTQAVEERPTTD